jgi:phosphoglycerate kinase
MRNLKEFDFKGKNVLVRCDFNVPLSEKGEILDDFRIKTALPTINYLRKQGARVILMSHLEEGGRLFSLKTIIPKLEELLEAKVHFFDNYLNNNIRDKISQIDLSEIILLENLRFHKEEKQNDIEFAKKISKLGDIFVNEAFSVCHRNHSSVCAIAKFLPSAAGFALEKEIKYLTNILKQPKRPFVAIMGGIKIETKIKTILNIIDAVDNLLLGSKLGEVILADKEILKDRNVPKSDLLKQIDLTNSKLHLPVDGHIGPKDIEMEHNTRKAAIGTIKKEEEVYDIGPETIKMFGEIIKTAKTILWNGPLGMYENKKFESGTKEIANIIVKNQSALKVVGGGETIDAIYDFGLADKFDFVSTGGGAMLHFLAGSELPGIEVLE